MPKYLKTPPDPDARVCHCGDGNPDCDHWESCDGCGMDYRKHEGHDCIDGVPVQDLRAMSKELRDALASCETERDRLRAQIAALQSVPQGVEVPEIPVDVLSSIEQDHSCEEWDWRAPAITAWFRRNARNPAVRVEVPPYPDVLVRQSIGHTERHAGIMEGVEWARKNARIVPTPPQPAPRAVVETQEFRREDRYVVLKRADLERYATPAQLRELERTCEMVRTGRMTEGKRINSYVVVADNWPEYEETWAKIQARVTGIPQPLQPEERRVGPDEVVVGREEWEVIEQIINVSEICATEVGTDRRCCVQTDDHYIPLTRLRAIRALRTSAQAHNGEEAK